MSARPAQPNIYAPIRTSLSGYPSPTHSGSSTPASLEFSDGRLPENNVERDMSKVVERVTLLGEADEGAVIVEGEDKVTKFVWMLVSAAAISGLLFGYDTAAISGMLVIIKDDLGTILSSWQKEVITSATTLGALLGGLAAGCVSDFTGRRLVIVFANVAFIGGSICQAACHTVAAMIAGRFIVGLGVGLASCIVPLYIGELAPTMIRGRLVTINCVAVTLGQVVAYAIGASFQNVHNGWRWIVGLGAMPSFVQLAAIGFLPESPRILLLRSDVAGARAITAKIYPLATIEQVDRKIEIMKAAVDQSIEYNANSTWFERLKSLVMVGTNRRALIIGCGLQAAQQLCGFNTLMYYSATIFAMLGFNNATAVGLIVATVNVLFTLVALKIVDPVGRRRTMLFTLPIMILALVFAAIFFYYLTLSTNGILIEDHDYPRSLSILVLLSMLLYVAGYATGLGNIPWQQGELFRLEVRGIGTSICTAVNWSCNMLIAGTFLSLMDAATPSGAFGIYAGFCVIGWVFCWMLYPETSGLSLEEVYFVFEEGFGIKKSQQLRKQKLVEAAKLKAIFE
ncbi:MFS transporter, SP family, solute carrier family 2 (myo-inositol transporter), member 13 [Cryptococcus neoformans c8]|nr:MFS transporter, SP family, solute carrier family 2 (myo-inositol transporter), member 13 [Cryptococcus neoformans var. grubii AD1-83a]OXG69792.1 MFS transporter, SP family, solute carrier family 2 (myo-inositol transporter), member 13 [Cryptococcus neoformans var. grubii c8]OXG70573.1 MFS transporter, SP family, solute carrier family 2 (myo-inositol transporter), member 13 [Cryptococcus neoformans var. grubii MW-RSA1955]OXG74006.1 MFS transporter, SP family, solute carrier family 2 (myo-inos